MTSMYDNQIAKYLENDEELMPKNKTISLDKISDLRYGENPHQKAAFYIPSGETVSWNKHQGKTFSYNNLLAILLEIVFCICFWETNIKVGTRAF